MRTAAMISIFVTVPLLLGGCTPYYDDVLWRQVVLPYKDLVGQTLTTSSDLTSSSLADQILSNTSAMPSQYWDGRSDPADFNLAQGGLAIWDVVDHPGTIQFDGLISSGPRDAVSDPPIHSGPYFGASSVYTCFTVVASVPAAQYDGSVGYEDLPCPVELVATLDPGAIPVPIGEFQG